MHRNPLCGRNLEYYSEDPYLTGRFATIIVKAIQRNGVAVCIKHMCCNEKEAGKIWSDSQVSERALRETRRSGGGDPAADAEKLLEACEFAANLLETGELVPMDALPTARIEAYRREEAPDCDAIRDFLTELIETLRRKAHVIRSSDGFRELRK